jgi:D-alanyl-D-alanine carboxypeptidase (penicillin-binding protein 5/6)
MQAPVMMTRRTATRALAAIGIAFGALIPAAGAARAAKGTTTTSTLAPLVALPGDVLPADLPAIHGVQAFLVGDASTGAILAVHDLHTPHLTASTVKVVTALTAVQALGPNGKITVTADAASRPPERIGMAVGEVWPMDSALHSLLMQSANDAAYAVAETAGHGSLAGFARLMTATAKSIGATDGTFSDPAGLDDPKDTRVSPSRMSTSDLFAVARAALASPVVGPIVRTYNFHFTEPNGTVRYLRNHNTMLSTFPGAIGVKTGYTKAARGTYIGAAVQGGHTLVVAELGVTGSVFTPAKALLSWGFAHYAAGTTTTVGAASTTIAPVAAPATTIPAVSPTITAPASSTRTGGPLPVVGGVASAFIVLAGGAVWMTRRRQPRSSPGDG